MNRSISKKTNQPRTRTIFKIIILILALPVIFLALYFFTMPLFEVFEEAKFKSLDSNTQALYSQIKNVATASDDWDYIAACSTNYNGPWPDGTYNCITSISLEKQIASVQELNDLHAKYYPIINNSSLLYSVSGAEISTTDSFGNKFNVSLAYKDYQEKSSGVQCTYRISLDQLKENRNLQINNDVLGSPIDGGKGGSIISFRCDEQANKPWFQELTSTSWLIPEL